MGGKAGGGRGAAPGPADLASSIDLPPSATPGPSTQPQPRASRLTLLTNPQPQPLSSQAMTFIYGAPAIFAAVFRLLLPIIK